MKFCPKCKTHKLLIDFGSNKARHDGVNSYCKLCNKIVTDKTKDKRNLARRQVYANNPELFASRNKLCNEKYKEKRILSRKQFYKQNKEKIDQQNHAYYKRNRDEIIRKQILRDSNPEAKIRKNKSKREWRKANPDKRRQSDQKYLNKDPIRKVIRNMRNRIFQILRRDSHFKAGHTIERLGCAPEFLKQHLESQFYSYIDDSGRTIEMTWDKLGAGSGTFQIDHIVALCLFDLSKPEEQNIANHYTNLQPLWDHDHIIKSQLDLELRRDFENEGKLRSDQIFTTE